MSDHSEVVDPIADAIEADADVDELREAAAEEVREEEAPVEAEEAVVAEEAPVVEDAPEERALETADAVDAEEERAAAEAELSIVRADEAPEVPQEERTMSILFNEGAHEVRALEIGGEGAELFEKGLVAEIYAAIQNRTGWIDQLATQLITADGRPMDIPKLDTHTSPGIVAESGAYTDEDITLSSVTSNVSKYAGVSKLTSEMLQDTEVSGLEAMVAADLATQIGRAFNAATTAAVIAAATQNVPAAGVAAITADELFELEAAVANDFNAERGVWIMKRSTWSELRKSLTETTGAYLLGNLQDGAQRQLLGRPVYLDDDMPALATGNVTVLFGDFQQAVISRMVGSVNVVRDDSIYRPNGQIGIFADVRLGATVRDAGAFATITQA
jgi:HK97 family phage major capsid protein